MGKGRALLSRVADTEACFMEWPVHFCGAGGLIVSCYRGPFGYCGEEL